MRFVIESTWGLLKRASVCHCIAQLINWSRSRLLIWSKYCIERQQCHLCNQWWWMNYDSAKSIYGLWQGRSHSRFLNHIMESLAIFAVAVAVAVAVVVVVVVAVAVGNQSNSHLCHPSLSLATSQAWRWWSLARSKDWRVWGPKKIMTWWLGGMHVPTCFHFCGLGNHSATSYDSAITKGVGCVPSDSFGGI